MTPTVWAVVTAFRPDATILDALDALRDQVEEIVLVDDGSGSSADDVLASAAERGAHVVRLGENSGIGAALNAGISYALEREADAVVTFDQDSVAPAGFVAALTETHARASRLRSIGPVVPEYFADVRQVHHEEPDGTLVARHAIQSGMLLSGELLRAVGVMRADLFIDLVDTEFEMRCTAARRPTVAARGLRLEHSLGRKYVRTAFGRPFHLPGIPAVVTLSTPFRYYYRVRNRVVINREYGRTHPGWVARDTVLEIAHYFNAWVLARPRRALWAVYAGALRDARHRRMGRIPARVHAEAASVRWAAPPAE